MASNAAFSVCNSPEAEGVMMSQSFRPPGPPLRPAGFAGDSRAAGAGGPSCDAGLGGQPPGWAAPRTASATPGGEAWRSTGENGGRSNSNAWAGDHSTFSSSAGPQRPPWPDAPIPPAALVGSPMPANRPAVDIEEDNGSFSGRFEWEVSIHRINQQVFGNTSFRTKQREIINAVLARRDVFAMMPTGGGKSLCYQLSAIYSPGISIVVMPLISLMQDQAEQLSLLNVSCTSLVPTQTSEEQLEIYDALDKASESSSSSSAANGAPKILFCTPEKLNYSSALQSCLRKVHRRGKLDRFVVDEAHCVSQWGNDFRPDYGKLGALRQAFADTPILALTATATTAVLRDTVAKLGMIRPVVFRLPFDRPNLRYEIKVKNKNRVAVDMAELIKSKFQGQSGIVYCLSCLDCEKVAAALKNEGVIADFYHGQVEMQRRQQVQRAWMNDEIKVIVATLAFGMGINKKDVRFVLHSAMPKSLENYYQESGRAGRDGMPAECILFYNYYDKQRQSGLFQRFELFITCIIQSLFNFFPVNLVFESTYCTHLIQTTRNHHLFFFFCYYYYYYY
eukprot:GHVT01092735.1.p1 GENE.GHVT01092735.1~~GHVT01092735.1.p1  ORF type:complete len:563 (+),score=81.04 GHVT01092735.1:1178-2866(+)